MEDKKDFEQLIKTAVAWWLDPLILNEKDNFFIIQFKISGQLKALEALLTKNLEKQSETTKSCTLSTMYGSKGVFREFLEAVKISDNYFPTQTIMSIDFSENTIKVNGDQIYPAVEEKVA